MNIGEQVTWMTLIGTGRQVRTRIATGIITGEKVQRKGHRVLDIHVLWYSGAVPDQPHQVLRLDEREIKKGRAEDWPHLGKVTPFELLQQRHRQTLASLHKRGKIELRAVLDKQAA